MAPNHLLKKAAQGWKQLGYDNTNQQRNALPFVMELRYATVVVQICVQVLWNTRDH